MYLERSSGHIIMLFIEEKMEEEGRYYSAVFAFCQALDVLTRSSWVSCLVCIFMPADYAYCVLP
jgi:hypothetical protein